MHPFQNETTQIVNALNEAYTKIEAINNLEMIHLKNKVLMDLRRHIDALNTQLGVDPLQVTEQPIISGPITRMFGKDVTPHAAQQPRIDVNKPVNQSPEDVAYAELQLKVDELYPRFLSTPSDHLLDSVSNIEILGIAKKAGLPVTEAARIDTKLIDQIKKAIQKQIGPEEETKKKDKKA